MKCNKCENDATFFYSENINGRKMETALCADCAEKEGMTGRFAEFGLGLSEGLSQMTAFGTPSLSLTRVLGYDSPFSVGSFGAVLWDDKFFIPASSPTERFVSSDLFRIPGFRVRPEITAPGNNEAGAKTAHGMTDKADDELSKRRELNELQQKMRLAAEREDFEEAIKIREQIKAKEL